MGAPILFQGKLDGSLQLFVYYEASNEVRVKSKYPMPFIMDLFDYLSKATYFAKRDLRFGY